MPRWTRGAPPGSVVLSAGWPIRCAAWPPACSRDIVPGLVARCTKRGSCSQRSCSVEPCKRDVKVSQPSLFRSGTRSRPFRGLTPSAQVWPAPRGRPDESALAAGVVYNCLYDGIYNCLYKPIPIQLPIRLVYTTAYTMRIGSCSQEPLQCRTA